MVCIKTTAADLPFTGVVVGIVYSHFLRWIVVLEWVAEAEGDWIKQHVNLFLCLSITSQTHEPSQVVWFVTGAV